jgi:hypothetical protein
MKLVALVAVVLTATAAQAEVVIPDTAMQATFEPGKSGEAFEVSALLQGCGTSAELDGCTFYAEGARWVVARGGASNAAALEAMALMPVNTALLISGDQISMGDITVEAAVAKIAPGIDAFAENRALMQGNWVSQDDALASLEVVGSEQTDSYDGQVVSTSVVTFSDSCPDGAAMGPVFFTFEMGGDPANMLCYEILDLTADRMELSYVGRGNTLVYLRK